MPADAIALKGYECALQPGVQTQAVNHAHRNELALGIARRVAGVLQVVAVDRPDGATRQFGKRPSRRGCRKRSKTSSAWRLRRPWPRAGGNGARQTTWCGQPAPHRCPDGPEGVAAGIQVAQDALETALQELGVTEFRGCPAGGGSSRGGAAGPARKMFHSRSGRRVLDACHHNIDTTWPTRESF